MILNNSDNRIKLGASIVIVIALIAIAYFKFNIDESVFNFLPTEKEEFSWDEYVLEREKRNRIKMKMSYEELLSMGKVHRDRDEWIEASENFFYAKSIYPDRIEPRKQLCYIYLMRCQEDFRYCDKAKKEIYYAMKYVHENDVANREYLAHLVDLVDIHDLIEMEESEALALIF